MKYGGTLVYRIVDAYGPIEVVESHGVRSLHFGSSARQSALDLGAPDQIELAYLRSMLVPLIFVPRPRRVLLLGLGGGTLAKFLLTHFPDAEIEAVELRPGVVEVAQVQFHLEIRPPLEVHLMDAHHYLQSQAQDRNSGFDLIFVDIFDAEGPSLVLEDPEFFMRISEVLAPRGAIAVNLWSGEGAAWRDVQALIRKQFKGEFAGLSVPGRGNRIYFALGENFGTLNPKVLREKARELEQRLGIEFVRMFERLEFLSARSTR